MKTCADFMNDLSWLDHQTWLNSSADEYDVIILYKDRWYRGGGYRSVFVNESDAKKCVLRLIEKAILRSKDHSYINKDHIAPTRKNVNDIHDLLVKEGVIKYKVIPNNPDEPGVIPI